MKNFNVRVYGIWVNDANEILLSDEQIGDFQFTKFPGGGLEFGEGIKDCLIREWKEELDADIEVLEHVYTTDFFQKSAFDESQVISIYYKVRPLTFPIIDFKTMPFDFDKSETGLHAFRWKSLQDITENDVTLPIDKKVISLISK